MSLPLSVYERLPKRLPLSLGFSRYSSSFDGIDDRIEVPDSPSLRITDAITVVALVKPLSLPFSLNRIARKWDTDWSTFWDGWRLSITSDGKIAWNWSDGTFPNVGIVSVSPISLLKWSDIATVIDGTVGRIYINGKLDIEEDKGRTLNFSTLPLWVNDPWTERLNGIIAHFLLYNRVLQGWEIRHNMLNYHSPVRDGLVLWLDLEEGVGLTAYDKSGYGNNGTIYGAIWVRNKMWELRAEVGL